MSLDFSAVVAAAQIDAAASSKLAQTEAEASRTLLEELPILAKVIGSATAERRKRLHALERIASALVVVARSGSAGIQKVTARFDTSIVDHIVAFCKEDHALADVAVQGNALSLLSNLTYLGELELVVHSGAPSLYVTLLTSPDTPEQIVDYAVAGLGNLMATPFGAASLTDDERASVVGVLEELVEAGSEQQRTRAQMALKNMRLRDADRKSDKARNAKAVARARRSGQKGKTKAMAKRTSFLSRGTSKGKQHAPAKLDEKERAKVHPIARRLVLRPAFSPAADHEFPPSAPPASCPPPTALPVNGRLWSSPESSCCATRPWSRCNAKPAGEVTRGHHWSSGVISLLIWKAASVASGVGQPCLLLTSQQASLTTHHVIRKAHRIPYHPPPTA